MVNRIHSTFLFVAALSLLSTLGVGCVHCLVEGTLVATPCGPVPVENLRLGQEVVSVSPEGQAAIGRVVGKNVATAIAYVELSLEGQHQALKLTATHPVATEAGWTPAGQLHVGDAVRTRIGLQRVRATRVRSQLVRVYDISVLPHSNFMAEGVIVHNKTILAPPQPGALVGVWLGQLGEGFEGIGCRLELRHDGTGLCAFVCGSGSIELYDVPRWNLRGFDLDCTLRPLDESSHATAVQLRGTAYLEKLQFAFPDEGAFCRCGNMEMRRESELIQHLQQLRNAMEDYK